MKIYKNKWFHKWASTEGVSDNQLTIAVKEINDGIVDASLGSNAIKKRIATAGKGKSGGARSILAFKTQDKAFFIYGFAKNKRDNISNVELKSLKLMAKELLSYNDRILSELVKQKKLYEVINNE